MSSQAEPASGDNGAPADEEFHTVRQAEKDCLFGRNSSAAQENDSSFEAILEGIDILDEARTVTELARHLKPILKGLALNLIMGEGAAIKARKKYYDQIRSFSPTEEDDNPPPEYKKNTSQSGYRPIT
jgi:hypothetical protein